MTGGDRTDSRPALIYVLHAGNMYGTERVALATAQAMSEYKRRIILAPPGGEAGSALDAAIASGMEAVQFTNRRALVRALRKLMSDEPKMDVVTTSITQSLAVAATALSTRCRIRHLHAVHGNGDATSFRWKPLLAPLGLRYMAVSAHVRDQLVDHHVPRARIILAENFLEGTQPSEQQRASYRERPPGSDGPVRVAVVGRADDVKRLELVIEAVSHFALDEMRIDVFGTGPLLEDLVQQALPYANVTFHGYVADVGARLAQADFLLHTCPVETFGLVILEAFRAGTIPIVPDTGGTAALVDSGQTGYLYRAGDIVDLVHSLRAAAAESPAVLDAMANAAREIVRTRFSAEQGARVYRNAFAQVGG